MRIARSLPLVIALFFASAVARGQGPMGGPTYQRTRGGADHGPQGGNGAHWGSLPSPGGYGGFNNSYYNSYYSPPIVAGSYYQRPYPYHFDYYRYRWGGQMQQAQAAGQTQVEMIPVAECPCVSAPAGEPAAVAGPAL